MGGWSIFNEEWWLNEVCKGGDWGVGIVKHNGIVLGRLPWSLKNKFGLRITTMPPFTQTLGPWILPPPDGTKYFDKLAREKDILSDLISQLPPSHYFDQNFSPIISNILPWHWHGFNIGTACTYRLHSIKDHQGIDKNLQSNIRGYIKKAYKNGITITISDDLDLFLAINRKSFLRQRMAYPYPVEILRALDRVLESNNARKILIARDQEGRVHAGMYLVYTQYAAYNLLLGRDADLPNYGATSLLMTEAIKFASTVTDTFDFEGSMVESIERFFRAFGAIQTPILRVTKSSSLAIDLIANSYKKIKKL